jgi:hypothetical protein
MPVGLGIPSLVISVCQSRNCKSFDITEETGVYNSSSNPGGYGGGINYDTTDVIDSSIIITLPDGTQVTFDSLSASPSYPTLPDSTGTVPFTITNTMLGITGALPDGIYEIFYQIDINNVFNQTQITNITTKVLLSCNVKCCVEKMFAKIPDLGCDCNDMAVKDSLLAWTLYQSLLNAGACGNESKVNNILDRLNKLCNIKNCGCN